MGTTKIVVQRGLTINTGNYENEKVEARIEYEVEDGQTVEQARAAASRELIALLYETFRPLMDTLPEYRATMFVAQIGVPKTPPPLPPLDDDDLPFDDFEDEDFDDDLSDDENADPVTAT